jgi:hypothetical protein
MQYYPPIYVQISQVSRFSVEKLESEKKGILAHHGNILGRSKKY